MPLLPAQPARQATDPQTGAQYLLPGFDELAHSAAPARRARAAAAQTPARDGRDLYPTFAAVLREVRPRAPRPRLEVGFYPFTHLNNTIRLRQQCLYIRVSDLLAAAPEPVMEALAQILIRKIYRQPVPDIYARRFRRHILHPEISRHAERLRQLRGRKQLSGAQGEVYDLEEIFRELNREFFADGLRAPRLSWNRQRARRHLAHYDAAHHAIVVSRIFAQPQAPRHVLAYVLYHEMLQLIYPVRVRGERRCVHSREFQAEERRFPRWREAEAWLRRL